MISYTPIVAPIYKSIVRFITDMIDELNATGLYPQVQYIDWESRNDETKLPQVTLLGPDGFSFSEDNGLWTISFALGLSSFRDANLLNEIELLDAIQQKCGEQRKVPLLEMVNGDQVNELVVTTWQLLPMAQSDLRNYRTIGMELKRTGT